MIVNRKSKITLKISLRARIRAFHQTSPNRKSYDLRLATSNISYNGGKKAEICFICTDCFIHKYVLFLRVYMLRKLIVFSPRYR